jgi:hypothetical protein
MFPILIVALAVALAFAAPASAQQTDITCASIRDARTECPVGRAIEDVRLLRQTSEARCIPERTWGLSRGKLWVDQGCAGVFRVFKKIGEAPAPQPGPGAIQTVNCASINHKLERCIIAREANWIRLRNRTSDARCDWKATWATETGAIWVDRGCGAKFELSYSRRRPEGGDWREISSGGGQPRPAPPPPAPAPWPGQSGGQGGWQGGWQGGHDGDRRDREAARVAIRLCRRYGEDRPELFNARWAEARPAESYSVGRRGSDLIVEGRYNLVRRGPDGSVSAICRVRGDRVAGFALR